MTRARGPKHMPSFKRRRMALTDYKRRFTLLKSGKPRLVVRKTNKRIIVQVIQFHKDGDKIIATADSTRLSKLGWVDKANIPTAYLTGYMCGGNAFRKGVSDVVLDMGMVRPTKCSIIYAAMKGALDAGLKFNYDTKVIIPERINGGHIAAYASKLKKEDKSKYDKLFSVYIKKGIDPEEITKVFEKVKKELSLR